MTCPDLSVPGTKDHERRKSADLFKFPPKMADAIIGTTLAARRLLFLVYYRADYRLAINPIPDAL
jgi:hypothetical protein